MALISGGRIVAAGTPSDIGGRDTASTRIRFGLPAGLTVADLPPAAALAVTSAATLDGDGLVTVETTAPTQALHELTGWALRHDAALGRLTVDRPSLEDVYLRLTSDADVPYQVKEKSTP